jgi:hypothetical protein
MSASESATPVVTKLRELASREGDGISVTLLWDPAEDRVLLDVCDARADESFVRDVEAADALDAFYHPFAYKERRSREEGPPHASSLS